jgi:hypothetical protein
MARSYTKQIHSYHLGKAMAASLILILLHGCKPNILYYGTGQVLILPSSVIISTTTWLKVLTTR